MAQGNEQRDLPLERAGKRIYSTEEARAERDKVLAGEYDDNPAEKRKVQDGVLETIRRINLKVEDPTDIAQEDPKKISGREAGRVVGDLAKNTVGMGEIGLTMATGYAAEALGGVAGMLTGLLNIGKERLGMEPSSVQAAQAVAAVTDALTFEPRTDAGEEYLQSMAAPLVWVDDHARELSTWGGHAGPVVSMLTYTAIMGGLDLVALGKLRGLRNVTGVHKRLQEIEETAGAMGVKLNKNDMPGSIVDAARKMSPEERAANAPALRQALLDARALEAQRLAQVQQQARANSKIQNLENIGEWGEATKHSLVLDKHNVSAMPHVQQVLKEVDEVGKMVTGDNTSIHLNPKQRADLGIAQLDRATDTLLGIENRLSNKFLDEIPGDERIALQKVKNELENFIDNKYATDLASGDPARLQQWANASKAKSQYNARWNEDRALRTLLNKEAEPFEISEYVRGQSAIGAKPQAVRTVRRLKEILGENHPAIEGIKLDYTFDLVSPLFGETPSLSKFIKGVDAAFSNNKSLMTEMGMETSDIRKLRDMAVAAQNIPSQSRMGLLHDIRKIIRGGFVLGMGSSLAKAAQKINIATGLTTMATGINLSRHSKKAILMDVANAQFIGPAIPTGSAAAGRVQARALQADLKRNKSFWGGTVRRRVMKQAERAVGTDIGDRNEEMLERGVGL